MLVEAPEPPNRGKEAFEELDPTGRYGRYKELLGTGAVKKVYKAFDQEQGIEVAWNKVNLRGHADTPKMLNRLFGEVRILKSIRHPHILSLHKHWLNRETETLNFITEICNSGDLRGYRKKHKQISLNALKKWAYQVLMGLDFLHTHEPCVIHRDLNCSNIFINGNVGKVKIGDLGLAAIVDRSHVAHSLLGTPEFMAPELFEEDYTELVDIYSFGLCVLEMITMEMPFNECTNVVQIYMKVTAGGRPDALSRVDDPDVARFIEKCLGRPRDRPSAAELMCDPFFDGVDVKDYCLGAMAFTETGNGVARAEDLVNELTGLIVD